MSDAPCAYIGDIGRHEGETITLKGRLYNKRSSGKLHFLQRQRAGFRGQQRLARLSALIRRRFFARRVRP